MSDELLEAADRGDLVEVRRLIGHGVDVNYRNHDGPWICIDAINIAAYRGHVEVVCELVAAGARDLTFIDWAINQQHVDVVRAWTKLEGARKEVNESDDSGGTTLLMWASAGSLEIVQMLVEIGADVDARSSGDDESALDVAVRTKNVDVIKYLWPLCSQETRDRAGLSRDPGDVGSK